MITEPVVWHGTQEESSQLLQALSRNCSCAVSMLGVRTETCIAHQLLSNQRVLDGLLFARHIVERLRSEEFPAGGATSDTPASWLFS